MTWISQSTVISDHVSTDWCHLCGNRSRNNVDISYPGNAEHNTGRMKYVRICQICLLKAIDVIKKEGK